MPIPRSLRGAALACLAACTPALSQNPLPLENGGFENGLAGWTVHTASPSTAAVTEDAASIGKCGLRVTRSPNAADEIVSPRVNVTPGKAYLLSFWSGGGRAGSASVEMVFYSAQGEPLPTPVPAGGKKPRTYVAGAADWGRCELGAIAPEAAALLALRIKPAPGSPESAVDFDDLQIEETSVPPPAPASSLPTDSPRIQELKAEIGRDPTRGKAPPKIVLKLDDLKPSAGGISPQWQRVTAFARERNIKLALGIIAQTMETGDPAFFDWVKQEHAAGRIEFWNHGYDHAAGEGALREFFNQPYAHQKEHLARTNQLAREKLGFPFVSFGAPFNQTDAATAQVLAEDPDIKVWIYGDAKNPAGKTVLHRNAVTIETGGRPDFQAFLEAYAHNRGRGYFVMQGHAGGWRDEAFEQFRLMVEFLIAQKAECVFPRELAGAKP